MFEKTVALKWPPLIIFLNHKMSDNTVGWILNLSNKKDISCGGTIILMLLNFLLQSDIIIAMNEYLITFFTDLLSGL